MTSTTTEPSTYTDGRFSLLDNEYRLVESGHTTVIAVTYDADDRMDAVIGRIERDGDIEYLGCDTCGQEITRTNGGLCDGCRSDLAARYES